MGLNSIGKGAPSKFRKEGSSRMSAKTHRWERVCCHKRSRVFQKILRSFKFLKIRISEGQCLASNASRPLRSLNSNILTLKPTLKMPTSKNFSTRSWMQVPSKELKAKDSNLSKLAKQTATNLLEGWALKKWNRKLLLWSLMKIKSLQDTIRKEKVLRCLNSLRQIHR